jgi:hypothetical protein
MAREVASEEPWGWQPLDSAPRDGTEFLAAYGDRVVLVMYTAPAEQAAARAQVAMANASASADIP